MSSGIAPGPIPDSMRAAVYRGVDDLRVEQVERPVIGPGEALVRIAACGVCGTDLKKIHYGLQQPPRIYGHEMAGTIVALGEGAEGWSVGDRVAVMHHVPCMDCYYCRIREYSRCPLYLKTGTTAGFEPAGGGYADYIRVMDFVVQRGMERIPVDISWEEATFVEPVNTVLKGVLKVNAGPEKTALVIGQGQIGLLFTQLLTLQGATVYATDPLPFRREQSVKLGAAEAFDPAGLNLKAELKARTSGRGADIAVVAVASTSVVPQAFEAVRDGGKVLLFAQTRLADMMQVDAGAICMLEKDLMGSYSSDTHLQKQSAELVFTRAINVRDLITHRFPLEEISTAIDVASSLRDDSLKVMVNL
jgi:L-iditol 2-dehydrogenase